MNDKLKHKLIGGIIASTLLGTPLVPHEYSLLQERNLKLCQDAYYFKFNDELPINKHGFQTYPRSMKEVPECKSIYKYWWADFKRSHPDVK